MNLIDRYLHEVSRYLPGKNREDILAEIRSHLTDTLEARVQGEPNEEDVSSLLKETGSPRKLAASYPGGEEYLVGPELYPFFRMVTGIVLAAVLGAQLLAVGVGLWMGEETFDFWEVFGQLVMSVPVSIGWVVIVFRILQWRGVHPDLDDEVWDPKTLPMVNEDETFKKGKRSSGSQPAALSWLYLQLSPTGLVLSFSLVVCFTPIPSCNRCCRGSACLCW